MSEIVIRRLASEDAEIFRTIRLEALRQEPAAFCASHDVEAAEPLEKFTQRLERSAIFAAFDHDAIRGMAGFLIADAGTPQQRGVLWGMYVSAQAQKRGIGAALLTTIIAHARTEVEMLHLGVVEENLAARRLYEQHGFRKTGIDHRVLPHGRAITEVAMTLALRAGGENMGGRNSAV